MEKLEGRLKEAKCGKSKMKVNLTRFGRKMSVPEEKVVATRGGGRDARVTNDKSFKDSLVRTSNRRGSTETEVPTLEVVPAEEALDEFMMIFVGYLKYPREARLVQIWILMEGWKLIKVVPV